MKYIYAGKPGSNGAKSLAQALGIRRIRHSGSRVRLTAKDTLINWGATNLPAELSAARIINAPEAIREASNKLSFFRKTDGQGVAPEWTDSREQADRWLRNGTPVVCRTILNGSGGRGIVIAEHDGELVNAPLYVKYVPKKYEYRIHIFRGNVIDMQQKARRLEDQEVNWKIRNLENGFIYKRQGIKVPESAIDVARRCFNLFKLDFGAVDVIYNNKNNIAYTLEINSAPGLEGQTVENYASAFKGI